MSFDDFITKYNGTVVDTDGAYGGQCMDLMHKYIVDCLNLPLSLFAAPTAYEAYKAANDARFTKIDNTPIGVPQKGDIIFWNTGIGSAGHVAIFIEGDANNFKSFDQNFPTGSPCHIQDHTYKSVAGWLHYIDIQSTIDELRAARDNNWNLYQTELSKNNDLAKQLQEELQKNQDLREANDKLTTSDADLGAQLLEAQHKATDEENTIQALAQALNTTTDLKALLEAVDKLKTPIDEQVKPLQDHALSLQKVLDDLIYKKVPKDFWAKIRQWLKTHIGI